MLDESELEMLADAARGALGGYPDALGVLRGNAVGEAEMNAAAGLAADQGWLGLLASEDQGGLALGMQGATVLAREIGRALMPGPFVAGSVLLPALANVAPEFQPLLEKVIDAQARAVMATPVSGANGATRWLVDHAPGASDLLAVELSGDDRLRVCWFGMPETQRRDPFDPTCPIAEIPSAALEDEPRAEAALEGAAAEEVLGTVHLWIAAELLGIAQRAGELAIQHACERHQFGRPIGSYQGIKHRIVDDYVSRENAASIIEAAAQAWDAGQPDRLVLAHAARAAASEAALSVTGHCVQVHGGIGFSWEHPAHLYYKRARRLASVLGSAKQSRDAVGCKIFGVER